VVKKDPRIDAYIAGEAEFARPILARIRKLVHQGCPDAVETLKWSRPHFLYKDELLCGMSGFKAHAAFGFWKGSLLVDTPKEDGMGQFGMLKSVQDLPSDKAILGYIKAAMKLADAGVKAPNRGKDAKPKPPIKPPAWFMTPLKQDKTALRHFEAFSPSKQREYLEWLTEAKTDATRAKRLATALEWIAEGKEYNWKYKK